MLSLRPRATLSHPPSPKPHSLRNFPVQSRSQTNRISHDSIQRLKSADLRKCQGGPKSSIYYFNLYLRLHVNAGHMEDAQKLFDEMPERTLISWTILMSGYAKHGLAYEALVVFRDMLSDKRDGRWLSPDSFVYSVVLRACAAAEDLNFGRVVHGHVLKRKGFVDDFVENALVNMYASCGSLAGAVVVFDRVGLPDLIAWSSLLNGYVRNGYEEEGLRIFLDMISHGVEPDAFTFSMVIGACGSLGCLDLGSQLHCSIIKKGLGSLFLGNSLMDFYAKCGNLEGLRQVFDKMIVKDLVSWNTLITGYVQNFHYLGALSVFRSLMDEISHCDDFTLTCILKAVAQLGNMYLGREVHGYILRAGWESNHYVISSLLDMYIECIEHGSLDPRARVPLKVYNCLEEGRSNGFVTVSMLKWCSLQSDLEVGEVLHSSNIKLSLTCDPFVVSSLIDMYSKCGMPEASLRVFLRVKSPGVASWSALISGYSWNGLFDEALTLFRNMQFESIEANEFTFTSVLQACLALRDIRKAREVHCKILKTGYGSNVSVVNALINLYSELCYHKQALNLCSFISDAGIPWNLLIQSCCKANEFEMVLELLRRIQLSRVHIDQYSVAEILSSCGDPVLLNVGTHLQAYVMKRGLISYPVVGNSLIKMYSECGDITNAVLAFNSIPEKNSLSWTSIISAKVDHGHPLEALAMLKDMRRKGKEVNPSVFNSALKACAQMQLVDEACRLFTSMEEVYRIRPSEEHFSSMIDVLGRAGMFEEAQKFINRVIPFSLDSTAIWTGLLSSCRIHGNMKLAKYAVEKLLELDPCNCSVNVLLQQVLLMLGKWDDASKMKLRSKVSKANSSWIEIQNKVYEFVPEQNPMIEVSDKLAEIESKMEEMGYMADRNHMLHDAEEEAYDGAGLHHTEMKAAAFGLISLPNGVPIRVVKSIRMCGDCHSACKFMSTFIDRDLLVKDPCSFHHFRDGKCSCRDAW